MILLGLTGGIAMGKSTVARQFALLGAVVHNADSEVHRLLGEKGGAVAPVGALFPDARAGNRIDRRRLGEIVFHDKAALRELEKILHPRVIAAEREFVMRAKKLGKKLVVLDIPLLFETGAEARFDLTATVTAPPFLQEIRAMARPGMTRERLAHILAQQMPDGEKLRRADAVIPTGLGKAYSFSVVKSLVKGLMDKG